VYHFHARVYAAPDVPPLKKLVNIADRSREVLDLSADQVAGYQFACTFEQAASRLAALERMYVEPDGSFVWVSSSGDPAWQIDGNLYDRAGQLQFVDIKGSCSPARFDELLATFGWPAQPVIFELVSHGVFMNEQEFRRWAECGDEGQLLRRQ
jgi:hypothetical protein